MDGLHVVSANAEQVVDCTVHREKPLGLNR